MDGIHDMGGMHGFGPVDANATASGHEGWETRLQAVALMTRGITRAGIEALDPAVYLAATYHERWLLCAEERLVAKGAITAEALERWRHTFIEDPEAQPPRTENPANVADIDALLNRAIVLPAAEQPRFAVGDRVRVRRMRPVSHHRCPRYLRGAVGEIETVAAQDHVPGTHPGQNQAEPVYTVRFASTDLFGDHSNEGQPPYELYIDLWQSYLEAP